MPIFLPPYEYFHRHQSNVTLFYLKTNFLISYLTNLLFVNQMKKENFIVSCEWKTAIYEFISVCDCTWYEILLGASNV